MTDIPFIVSADWLQQNQSQPTVKICDASSHLPTTGRDAQAEFLARRIRGARRFDINIIADTTSDCRSPILFYWRSRICGWGIFGT